MDTNPFNLTPEQQGMLAVLSRETGKPIPVLIAQALAELQAHVGRGRDRDDETAHPQPDASPPSVLEIFRDAREGIPQEIWEDLPQDLAAQHDHYIYGTPKHPS